MIKYILALNFLFLTILTFGRDKNFIKPHGPHVNAWKTIASGTLGPNALPVPELRNGRIGTEVELEARSTNHWMHGDNAVDLFFRLYYPVVSDKVAFEVYGVPLEYFRSTNEVRDFRQVDLDDNGWQIESGDIYLATYIQLIRDWRYVPDISVHIATKTTTGNLREGRYTDSPANIFNVYLGKKYPIRNSFITEINYSGMAGFYVWQTNRNEVSQDEGVLLGIENEIRMNRIGIRNAVAGYFGYETVPENPDFTLYTDVPDQPMVYRGEVLKYGNKVNWRVRYEHGFRDNPYNSVSVSAIWHFDVKKVESVFEKWNKKMRL